MSLSRWFRGRPARPETRRRHAAVTALETLEGRRLLSRGHGLEIEHGREAEVHRVEVERLGAADPATHDDRADRATGLH